MANHESLADILVLLVALPLQVRFLAKRRIFSVPVLGWSIRAAGFIPVDRGDHRRGAATFEAALARLQGGRSVIVFEKEKFPREHVGESLVPSSTRVFKDLNFLPKMEEAKFPHKLGAAWTARIHSGTIPTTSFDRPISITRTMIGWKS